MKYQISGQELEKALELVSKVMNPLKKAESVLDRPSDEDLLFYDNVSMMDGVRFTILKILWSCLHWNQKFLNTKKTISSRLMNL